MQNATQYMLGFVVGCVAAGLASGFFWEKGGDEQHEQPPCIDCDQLRKELGEARDRLANVRTLVLNAIRTHEPGYAVGESISAISAADDADTGNGHDSMVKCE